MPTKMSAIRSVSVVSGCRAPRGVPVPGQRDVDPLLGQHPRVALGLELGQPRLVGLAARACAGGVDPLAGVGSGGRRQRAELAAGQQHRRAVAEVRGRTAASASRSAAAANAFCAAVTASSRASGESAATCLGS